MKDDKIYNQIEYLEYLKKMNDANIVRHVYKPNDNNFMFDTKIFKNANPNIKDDPIEYYSKFGIEKGLIINKKQILNYYPNVTFSQDCEIIYDECNIPHNTSAFVEENLYKKNIDFYINNYCIVDEEFDKSMTHDLIIIIHIGNVKIGMEMLNNIEKYNEYLICVSVIKQNDNLEIINFVKNNFKMRFIIETINYGSDVPPSIMIHNYLNKISKINNILKLHTKSCNVWRKMNCNIFYDNLNRSLNIINNNKQISSIGSKSKLMLNNKFCEKILDEIFHENKKHNFVAGTMFLIKNDIFTESIRRADKYLKPLFLNTFYYDNFLFFDNSPVHSFERIFGYSGCVNNNYNLGIMEYKKTRKCLIYALHIRNLDDIKIIFIQLLIVKPNVDGIFLIYSSTDNIVIDDYFDAFNNITILKVENEGYDFIKYKIGLIMSMRKYDRYILMNDSFIFMRKIDDFFDFIDYSRDAQLIGLLESYEIKQHYQSFLIVLDNDLARRYIMTIKNTNMVNKIITDYEVNLSNEIIRTKKTCSYYKSNDANNANFYNYINYVENTMYPIFKKKILHLNFSDQMYKKFISQTLSYDKFIESIDTLPDDFNVMYYKQKNSDLQHMKDNDAKAHFLAHGKKEYRPYSDNVVKILNPDFYKVVEIFKNSSSKLRVYSVYESIYNDDETSDTINSENINEIKYQQNKIRNLLLNNKMGKF